MHSFCKPKGDHLVSVYFGQQPQSPEIFSQSHDGFHCLDFVLRRINYSRLDSANQLCVSFLAVPVPFEDFWALFFRFFIWFALFWGFFCEGVYKGDWVSHRLVADSFLFLIDFWISLVELKEVLEVEQTAQWCSMVKKKFLMKKKQLQSRNTTVA